MCRNRTHPTLLDVTLVLKTRRHTSTHSLPRLAYYTAKRAASNGLRDRMGAAGDEFQIPAFQVETVDALGAGDSFVAGFVAGLSKGWDLHRTARFACAVGAMCVTALGATPGIRSLEETEAFIRQTSTRP